MPNAIGNYGNQTSFHPFLSSVLALENTVLLGRFHLFSLALTTYCTYVLTLADNWADMPSAHHENRVDHYSAFISSTRWHLLFYFEDNAVRKAVWGFQTATTIFKSVIGFWKGQIIVLTLYACVEIQLYLYISGGNHIVTPGIEPGYIRLPQ